MRTSKSIVTVAVALAGFFLLVTIPDASAQEQDWEFTADIYLWYASMGGESATGGDINIDAGDLIKNLDLGFMTVLGARKGKWSILSDIIYLNVSADNESTITVPSVPGPSIQVKSEVELEGWIVTPVVGYNLMQSDTARLDILAGARYLWLASDLELNTLGPLQPRNRKISDSGDVWDGIVGLKGELALGKNWSLPFYLDIGAGETNLTWQAIGGLSYKLKNSDLLLGYRYLAWDFDDNDVFDDMNISGPYAGLELRF
ncbi:MAG: hypothetical protein AMJ65_17545 [Phycisphaerae bacterium SG8_4]|nr:MAG: hypothetical protein AMJ65_17545 [Phycisphaerae bacterium SG8_4]